MSLALECVNGSSEFSVVTAIWSESDVCENERVTHIASPLTGHRFCCRCQHVSERWRERAEKDGRRARAAWWEFTHRRLRTIIINISLGGAAAATARKMARYWTNNERLRRTERTFWCKVCSEVETTWDAYVCCYNDVRFLPIDKTASVPKVE